MPTSASIRSSSRSATAHVTPSPRDSASRFVRTNARAASSVSGSGSGSGSVLSQNRVRSSEQASTIRGRSASVCGRSRTRGPSSTGVGHHVVRGVGPSPGRSDAYQASCSAPRCGTDSGRSPWNVKPHAWATRQDARLPTFADRCTTGRPARAVMPRPRAHGAVANPMSGGGPARMSMLPANRGVAPSAASTARRNAEPSRHPPRTSACTQRYGVPAVVGHGDARPADGLEVGGHRDQPVDVGGTVGAQGDDAVAQFRYLHPAMIAGSGPAAPAISPAPRPRRAGRPARAACAAGPGPARTPPTVRSRR